MVIYKITNLINGKVYIGQTRRGFEQRMKEHQNAAARGDGFYIGSAIAKYGWDNFSAEVIAQTSDKSVLDELEKYYIQKYKSDIVGYNLAPGGDTNTMDSPKVKAQLCDHLRFELRYLRRLVAKYESLAESKSIQLICGQDSENMFNRINSNKILLIVNLVQNISKH